MVTNWSDRTSTINVDHCGGLDGGTRITNHPSSTVLRGYRRKTITPADRSIIGMEWIASYTSYICDLRNKNQTNFSSISLAAFRSICYVYHIKYYINIKEFFLLIFRQIHCYNRIADIKPFKLKINLSRKIYFDKLTFQIWFGERRFWWTYRKLSLYHRDTIV